MWRARIGSNFKQFTFKSQSVGGKLNEHSPLVKYYKQNVFNDIQHLNPNIYIAMDVYKPYDGFKEHIEIRYRKSATTHRIFTEDLSDFQINSEIKKHLEAADELLKRFPEKKEPNPDYFYYFDRTKPVPPEMFPLDDRIANPE
eukprot:TRINITY_DN12694_c0_g1_i1.p1 TRINITY_DN12694_c0_g1~~TRINITY_DN12694_c0_g1_i1.p1  ORF type:complete len:143 (-),score=42.51 TRINITY_DN12694_c0_g1_i1:132-560(-)